MNEVEEKLLYKIFGDFVKKHREERCFSQNDLAMELNLSRPSISNIEAGNQNLSFDKALRLCRILLIDMNDIMTAFDSQIIEYRINQQPPSIQEILRRSLNKAEEIKR